MYKEGKENFHIILDILNNVFCDLRIILKSWKVMSDIIYKYNGCYVDFDRVINSGFAIASISNLRIQTQ